MNIQVSIATVAEIGNFVGGRQVKSTSDRRQPVFNPATGRTSANVALSNPSDVDAAVDVAQAAFPAWSDTPPIRRARLMNRFLALMTARKDDLARAITAEHGKVLADARGGGRARHRHRRVRLRHPAAAQG